MARLQPIPVTTVSGVRRSGWRGALREGSRTVWRCDCGYPHTRPELALACASERLGQRGSGYYPGRAWMDEWHQAPQSDAERDALGALLAEGLRREMPLKDASSPAALAESIERAGSALQRLRAAMLTAPVTIQDVHGFQAEAEYIKQLFGDVQAVRELGELAFLTGEWVIARKLVELPAAAGTRGIVQPGMRGALTGGASVSPPADIATLRELVGDRKYGWRLKTIARLDLEGLESAAAQLQRQGKEATLNAVFVLLRSEDTAWRRLDSLTTPGVPLSQGMDLRIGDCRVVLSDIADDSVPLIMTDPPYGNDAEPLYEWLAQFAARVLIPGGSLICYTGQGKLPRDMALFSRHLRYWWTAAMMHDASQRILGARVFAKWKPVLWFVKEHRRGRVLVPDVLYARRDKTAHDWAQGDGGVRVWIHNLTEPGETILDPFAGTAEWGRIACASGRHWVGSDVVMGGEARVDAGDITEEAGDA